MHNSKRKVNDTSEENSKYTVWWRKNVQLTEHGQTDRVKCQRTTVNLSQLEPLNVWVLQSSMKVSVKHVSMSLFQLPVGQFPLLFALSSAVFLPHPIYIHLSPRINDVAACLSIKCRGGWGWLGWHLHSRKYQGMMWRELISEWHLRCNPVTRRGNL